MRASIVAAILLLAACRGEPVPRDYQNAPPDVTHPPQTESQTPSAGATGQVKPEPSSGNEGPNPALSTPSPQPTTTTIADTPPTTTS